MAGSTGCTLPQDPQDRNAPVAPQLQQAPPPPAWFDRHREGAPMEHRKIPRIWRQEEEAVEDGTAGTRGAGGRRTRRPTEAAARWGRSSPAPRRHMVFSRRGFCSCAAAAGPGGGGGARTPVSAGEMDATPAGGRRRSGVLCSRDMGFGGLRRLE